MIPNQHFLVDALGSVSGGATASFVYEGDVKRVQAIEGGMTVNYIGNHYETRRGLKSTAQG